MAISSRKHPVQRPGVVARRAGLVLASLPGLALGAQPGTADGERVLRGVTVLETVEEGYRAENVSSPKFTAPLAEIPQTIAVIRKELLFDQGAGSLAEALRNTPGITFTLGENGNTSSGDSITMRGFDTSASIFLDGIRDLGAVSRDVFNTEQVEIVKGPSGSDNGRGAPTGYINLASKQPLLEDLAVTSLSGGSDSRLRFTGDLNSPLDAIDGAAVRLNLMYDKGDNAGRDYTGNERWGIAPSLALGLDGSTRAYFNYLFIKQDNLPDGGIPAIGILGYRSNSTDPAIAEAVNAAPRVSTRNFYGSLDDYQHVVANMFTARVEHDFGPSTTLRNTARYGRYTMERVITGVNTLGNLGEGGVVNDRSAWTVSRSRQLRDEENEILTNQTNLTTVFSTGAVSHSLSTGIEFIHESQVSTAGVATGTAQPANLYAPSVNDSFVALTPTGAVTDGSTTTAAAYLFDTLRFSEQWSLNLGLRFDHYRTGTTTTQPAATPPVASTRLTDDGNLFTGKAGLVYSPVENGMFYLAAATSEQPPGGTTFALNSTPTNINNPNLDPQEATNLEVGSKWELFDNQLVVGFAAFDTRNRNDQAVDVNGEVTQFGERRVRGVELYASGMITPGWQVSAGIASMDTEVKEGTAANTGAQLQFSPKLTFTSWTTYRFASGLTIGGGARYTDSQFRNGNATQAEVTNLAVNPSSWVIDLMASYDVTERLGVQVNVWNVANEFYLNSLNNGGSRFILGAPRSFLATVTYKWL